MTVLSRPLAAILLAVGAARAFSLPTLGCNDIDAAPAMRPGDFDMIPSCNMQGEKPTPAMGVNAQDGGHDDMWPDVGAPVATPAVETSSPIVTASASASTTTTGTGAGRTEIKGTGTGTFAIIKPTGDFDSGASAQVAPLYVVPAMAVVVAAMLDI